MVWDVGLWAVYMTCYSVYTDKRVLVGTYLGTVMLYPVRDRDSRYGRESERQDRKGDRLDLSVDWVSSLALRFSWDLCT